MSKIESTINGTGSWSWVIELANLMADYKNEVIKINNEEYRYIDMDIVENKTNDNIMDYTLYFEKVSTW